MPTNTTTQVNFRRGTAAQIASSFTPSTGEIVVDLTNSRIVVGDGFTLGGFTGAKITDVNTAIINLSGYLNSITGSIGGNQAGLNALSGNLGLTGQILYNDIIGLSGLIGSSSTVGATGSILYGYIIGESGALLSQMVHITGNEVINGVKTFNESINLNNNSITGLNLLINNSNITILDANNYLLNDQSESISIDINNRLLEYANQPVFDWKNGVIYDNNVVFGEISSIDTNNRLLNARSGNFSFSTAIDWQNNILYGSWNLGGSTGVFISTGQTGQFASYNSLYQTGQLLQNNLNSTSGALASLMSQTGATLINRDNSISGQLISYINQTGLILFNDIVGLSGQSNFNIALTGQQAWSAANNNAINLSGNLSQSGAVLIAKSLAISGILQNEINNISGSYIFTTPVLSGVGQQFISFPPVSGLGNNPLILCTLNNISGSENIFVQYSGATPSGYWAQYSNIIDNSGYFLTTMATSSQLSFATNVFLNTTTGIISGNYLPPSANFNTLIDWSITNSFYITLTGNTNFIFNNSKDGQNINVSVTNTGNLFYTGIWPSGTNGVKWPYQLIPIQTSGNFTDIYTFLNITGMIYGSAVQGF